MRRKLGSEAILKQKLQLGLTPANCMLRSWLKVGWAARVTGVLGWLGMESGTESGGIVWQEDRDTKVEPPTEVCSSCSFLASSDRLLFEVTLQQWTYLSNYSNFISYIPWAQYSMLIIIWPLFLYNLDLVLSHPCNFDIIIGLSCFQTFCLNWLIILRMNPLTCTDLSWRLPLHEEKMHDLTEMSIGIPFLN